MSVRTDRINLIVNVNGDTAKNQLGELRKKAADINFELKGLVKGTKEFTDKSKELQQVTSEMADLKKQIGITSLSMKELNAERRRLSALRNNADPLSKEFKDVDTQLQKVIARQQQLNGDVKGFKDSLVGAVAGGVTLASIFNEIGNGVKNFFSQSIDEAEDAEKATSRLKNTLENLGRLDVFDRLADKANEMADKFKFIDNDDVTGVFQQLITYGKLTEKQITDLTPVIIDFAAKSQISLSESASLIIKAMEGNAKALKEYGINMKDGADVSERFGLIMTELKPKVEGAAEAFGQTTQGQIASTRQEIKNLQEDVGTKLLPAVKGFYAGVSETLGGLKIFITNVGDAWDNLTTRIQRNVSLSVKLLKGDFAGVFSQFATNTAIDEANAKRKKDAEELTKTERDAQIFVRDSSTKSLAQQKQDLQQQEALLKASLDRYNEVKKAGIQHTKEGRDAMLQFITDANVVDGIRKNIKASTDKTTLGGGDPNSESEKAAAQEAARLAKQRAAEKQREYEQLKKEAAKFAEDIKKLRQEADRGELSADDAEIQRVEDKYKELTARALKYFNDHVTDKKTFDAQEVELERIKVEELQALFNKRFTKHAEEEYTNQLKISAEYFSDLRDQTVRSYALGQIDKEHYEDALKDIELRESDNRVQVAKDYSGTVKKASEDEVKFAKENEHKKTQNLAEETDKRKKLSDQERLERANLAVLTSRPGSDGRLQAQKNLLQLQFELDNQYLDKKSDLYLTKEKELQQQFKDMDKEANVQKIERIREYVGYFQDALGSLNQILTNSENRQLQRDRKTNDEKKTNLKKQLDSKLISQAQYDVKVNQLNDEQAKKESEARRKQAQREKALNIFNAVINTAAAVAKTFAEFGFPLGIPMAAAMAVLGGLQVAAIASTPLPELGTGDWLRKGDKHKDASGGIPAMIERDEAVISAAAMTDTNTYTVTGTTAQITSALNSKNGGASWAGGATMADWQKQRPAAINPSMPRIMEQGGVTRPLIPTQATDTGNNSALVDEVKALREDMKTWKSKIKGEWVIRDLDDTRALYDQAKKASGLNQ